MTITPEERAAIEQRAWSAKHFVRNEPVGYRIADCIDDLAKDILYLLGGLKAAEARAELLADCIISSARDERKRRSNRDAVEREESKLEWIAFNSAKSICPPERKDACCSYGTREADLAEGVCASCWDEAAEKAVKG